MKNKCIIRWLYGCLIFLNITCHQNKASNFVEPNFEKNASHITSNEKIKKQLAMVKRLVEAGDIITRTGNDFTSQSLKKLNRKDKTFSHCGIANIENDSLFVYHAIGGEWNPDQKIKRESFEAFTNPADNNLMGVYRFQILKKEKDNLVTTAKQFYESEIIFDMDFDLKTDDKMYCVEYVYKSFKIASPNQISFNHSFINHFEFVGVDDITGHALSKKIALVDYKIY